MELLYVLFIILAFLHRIKLLHLVRLENEHIGNTDQYRVTREVPLPYQFDEDDEVDGGARSPNDEDGPTRVTSRRSVRMPILGDDGKGSIRERRTILDDVERAAGADEDDISV